MYSEDISATSMEAARAYRSRLLEGMAHSVAIYAKAQGQFCLGRQFIARCIMASSAADLLRRHTALTLAALVNCNAGLACFKPSAIKKAALSSSASAVLPDAVGPIKNTTGAVIEFSPVIVDVPRLNQPARRTSVLCVAINPLRSVTASEETITAGLTTTAIVVAT